VVATAGALVSLSDARDASRYGGKASALARSLAAGHRVPEGLVLDVDLTQGPIEDGDRWLREALDRLGGSVAVRSSAVDEDGDTASFAGQYMSVLRITDEDGLRRAISQVVASASSSAALRYRTQRAIEHDGMAVLVQRMIEPAASGVAFSVDPVSGEDHVVIEATTGSGEQLLDGAAPGERWVARPEGFDAPTGATALEREGASEVAKLVRVLAAEAGCPVDVEWAFDDDGLWLLQVRPITVVPRRPAVRVPDRQTFIREPRFDRPLYPLSSSTWLPRHAQAVGSVMRRLGLPVDGLDERVVLGRVYGRMVPMMDRGSDGPPPPAWLMKLLLRALPAMRRRLSNAVAYDGDAGVEAVLDRWDRGGRAAADARTKALRAIKLPSLSEAELADHLDEVLIHVEAVADAHFELAMVGSWMATGRLGLLVDELLGWSAYDVVTLVQGYGESNTKHGRAVGALACALGPARVEAAVSDPSVLIDDPAVEAYLERHGHRVNAELASLTEAEDLRLVVDHLRRLAEREDHAADPRAAAGELEARAIEQLRPGDRARFQAALALARRGRPYGDETEATTLDALTLVRPIALEAARRFVGSGRVRQPEDVWFLTQPELSRALREPRWPLPDLAVRRAERAWALANPAPGFLGPEPVPPPPAEVIPARYRQTVGAVLWSAALEDEQPPRHDADPDDVLRGVPGSPGHIVGTVRIIRDMGEFARIEPGDVVVCPTTVAAWSPIFTVIGGLVTEHGGLLSHPATLAREYGRPAVLCLPEATTRLADGQRVELDGGAGTVTLV
jgi:pyruvate,water dikinase